MHQHKILDNFLPKEIFDNIYNFLTSAEFPWFYMDSVAFPNHFDYDENLNNFYFIHQFYRNNEINSECYRLLQPLLDKLNIFSLIRLQANLYTKTNEIVHHEFHTDAFGQSNLNWQTGVFYINSNDGKTIIKNNDDQIEVESIANRMLVFPANTLHKSTTSTNSKFRIVINVNYYPNT